MNKVVFIGISIFLLFSSCKKEGGPWDREGELATDSTTLIFEINYESHASNQLIVSVDMVRLTGLEAENNYSGSTFSPVSSVSNVDYSTSGISQVGLSSAAYSSVFLFNLNMNDWYAEHFVGFYLRRFFEMIDGASGKNIALSSFSAKENSPTRFYAEDHSNLFGNSWEYNTDKFYEMTEGGDNFNYQTSLGYLRTRIEDILDTLSAISPTGDKSITLFTTTDFQNTADTSTINAIINTANANQTKINIIGLMVSDQLRQIAYETGGFVSEYLVDFETEETVVKSSPVSHIGVTLQNLDNMLSRKVKVHRCTYQFDFNDASVYLPGDRISYPFNYNGYKFYVNYSIP